MTLHNFLSGCPKKQLIFDFDETLVHLILPWKEFKIKLHSILRKLDPDLKMDFQKSMVLYVNEFVRRNGQERVKTVLKLFEEFELPNLQAYPVNQSLFDFITQNKTKYDFYIWSSNMTSTITHVLKKLGYLDLFKKIIARDSVVFTKPEADGFFKIFTPGSERKDYVLIGDSDHDKRAAEKAGIDYFKIHFKVD